MTRLAANIMPLAAALLAAAGAAAQTSASPSSDGRSTTRFDGVWDAVVTCSDVNEKGQRAKGYVLQFPVEVKHGMLRGHFGQENVSNWLELEGRIEPDGSARLAARGLTGDPDYSVGRVQASSPYAYSVKAHFDQERGTGQRIELRPCQLTFFKRG